MAKTPKVCFPALLIPACLVFVSAGDSFANAADDGGANAPPLTGVASGAPGDPVNDAAAVQVRIYKPASAGVFILAAAPRTKEAQEKAEREKAAREKAAREKAAREKAAREKAAREKAAREKAAREKAAREKAAREEAARKRPGSEFRDCDQCPEMVVVPAGAFIMGSPFHGEVWYDNEGPQHRVVIGKPFAVGKYEVTFAEWDACVSARGCGHHPHEKGWGRGRRPVINVSWDDAEAYVLWLSRKTGKRYRLLSESEWEYAARAGTAGPFSFGTTISLSQANYRNYGRTVAVGSYAANQFGLHDMHGNVQEWVWDCWNENYVGAPNDGSAWTNGDCERRPLRGGSWDLAPWNLRSAYRDWGGTGNRSGVVGFRVARTL